MVLLHSYECTSSGVSGPVVPEIGSEETNGTGLGLVVSGQTKLAPSLMNVFGP